MKALSIIYNGEIISSSTPVLSADNRAFRFGDGLFESMKCSNGKILFYKKHLERIHAGLNLLKIKAPAIIVRRELEEVSSLLCRKNNIEHAKIRLQIYRGDGGIYTPDKNDSAYVLDCGPLESRNFGLNKRGLELGIFKDIPKPMNRLSNFKTCNSLVSVLASVYSKEKGLDDSLLMNRDGNYIESSNSNLFVIINDKILTPPLTDGCVDGIMRNTVIQLLSKNKIPCSETSISKEMLLKADEIFLTNAVRGIRWVKSLGKKTYKKNTSVKLTIELNKLIEL